MHVRWLKPEIFEIYKETLGVDSHIVFKSIQHNGDLCFYTIDENDAFTGLICAYEFEKSIKITAFLGKDTSTKEKLLKSLIQASYNKPLQAIITKTDSELFRSFGFETYTEVLEYISNSRAVAFNFTTNHAKEVNNPNFFQIAYRLNKKNLGDDMYEYCKNDMNSTSSLNLATDLGYLHSRGLHKDILISPFVINDMSYLDAEKLLRGVLHYRGLKKLKVFIPNILEIKELYESYKFIKNNNLFLVYLGEKPNIKLDNIYGF
ncbi:hypothetical protein [Arcobacter sp. FWKO B]|uniref:hypothetical protein n=1 Tax=Arcobacter sp. FWKO B TaxID=2593672 RepID=UPI0018A3E632|nr:hypothetical protein [Arcobacter sp. FWKO B]QOG11218.1 hypothetical protein FWKOB_00290 [Arcobacter sp. FWKO B]